MAQATLLGPCICAMRTESSMRRCPTAIACAWSRRKACASPCSALTRATLLSVSWSQCHSRASSSSRACSSASPSMGPAPVVGFVPVLFLTSGPPACLAGSGLGRCPQVLFVKAGLHDGEAVGVGGSNGGNGLGRRAREPGLRRLFGQEQRRAALRIDAAREVIGKRGDKAEDLDVDIGPAPFDRSFPWPIKTGKGEQRSGIVALEGKPVPARGRIGVGFAKGRGGDQAAP